jgi:hypothetical protein
LKLILKAGTTSKRLAIFVRDSSQTDGRGLTGLAWNTSGLAWYYWREDAGNAGGTAVTLASATRGTYTSGGFVEKDSTNMPGFYELGVPDAALATGAVWVVMLLRGAANMEPVTIEIELVAYDPFDGTRLGLSALPNAAAAATGGLPTVDANNAVKVQAGTGANQLDLASGQVKVQSGTGAGQLDTTSGQVKVQSGTGSGQILLTSGKVDVNDKTGFALSATAVDAIHDEDQGEGWTLRQLMRLMTAALLGKTNGFNTGTPKFRDQADTKDRISAIADADGNRTSVTLDAS